jgi:signal transduction histidine kinase
MRLDAARDLIAEDPAQAEDLVGQLAEQAREEIAEVRRLVDGLRPPALDQLGLVSALRQRVDEHNLAVGTHHNRHRMTWVLDADDDLGPLPAAVEVAAYRIVTEALTNVARHSTSDSAAVRLDPAADGLHLEVTDHGRSGAWRPGVGLSSMRERATELGGTLEAGPGPGGGRVAALLPL